MPSDLASALPLQSALTLPLRRATPSHRRGIEVGLGAQNWDSSFVAAVAVGTPPQQFSVVADSGSGLLWIPSRQCAACANTFDDSKSSTLERGTGGNVVLGYVSASVTGRKVVDVVTWGSTQVPAQPFLLVNDDGQTGQSIFADGVLGLTYAGGFDRNSSGASDRNSLLGNIFAQNSSITPMFSVWLNQSTHFSTTSANDPNGGKLVIGGTDTSLYNGTFSFLPILPRPYNTDGGQFSPSYFWTVAGKSISIRGGINIPAGSGTQVLVDTGTTLMTVDPDTFKNLITALSNNTASVFIPDSSRGIYACSCELRSTLPDIFINLGANGIPFVLTSTDYIMVGGSSGQCLLAIMPLKPSGANLWILGARFIQRYYTVFDFANAQVGFAVAADGRIPGNGQPLTAGDLAAGNSGTGFTVGSKRPSSAAISVALCGHLFSFWLLFFLSFWDI